MLANCLHLLSVMFPFVLDVEKKMKILNLLEACSIVGDALSLRMALASKRETMSSLMPLKDCLILLRVRLPWLRITRVLGTCSQMLRVKNKAT
jgi:hypothetical protein